jgi:ankyrin repeat protein
VHPVTAPSFIIPHPLPSCFGDWQVLQLVQQQGVDVSQACGPQGRTALHAAAEHGQHSCCSTLLELGADSYMYDGRQVSALMLAAMHGHDRVVKVRNCCPPSESVQASAELSCQCAGCPAQCTSTSGACTV